jgi:hypothetical protein
MEHARIRELTSRWVLDDRCPDIVPSGVKIPTPQELRFLLRGTVYRLHGTGQQLPLME